jgi:uncharacterized protein (TIGR02246 family)
MDDQAAILRLFAEYSQAVDGRRPDDVAALFTSDGVFEVMGATVVGREAIASMYRGYIAMGGLVCDKHVPSNAVVYVDGDRATARLDWCVLRGDGPAWQVYAAGHYEDELVKTDRWRFARRVDVLEGPVPPDAESVTVH